MKYFLFGFFLFPIVAFSQINYSRFDSIIVLVGTDTLKNPWAGGFNSPQFSSIDLNNDGIKDLFVFDRDGYIKKTFLNTGDSGKISYIYAPEFISCFPKELNHFVLLADYNCDGYEDIFGYSIQSGSIWVYRNTYPQNSKLGFVLEQEILLSYYPAAGSSANIYVSPINLPAITDIDNDGDIDILSFGVASQFVQYHQNQSMELYGTCDSLVFTMDDGCWGKFEERSDRNGLALNNTCRIGDASNEAIESHNGGTTLLAADLDSDGDKEYIQGQILYKNSCMGVNGGDANNAQLVAQDTIYPSNTVSAYIAFPAMYHLDVDNDGKKDMIAATNTYNSPETGKSPWFYKNVAPNTDVILHFENSNFLENEMIQVAAGANPVFFDHNSDGLMDIVIGNYADYNNTGIYYGKLTLYENIGTPTKPKFKLKSSDYSGLYTMNLSTSLYPAFGDLDGDGDKDMFVGEYDGKIIFFENTAGAGNTAVFTLKDNNYFGIDVGHNSAPQLVDMDRDGLLDLVIGEQSGNIDYYKNKGTINQPVFNNSPDTINLGGVDVMESCCTGYSSPYFYENYFHEYELFVGSEIGTIYHYAGIEPALFKFVLTDSINLEALRANISMADIDGDSIPEIIYGEYAGGCAILKIDSFFTQVSIKEFIVDNNFSVFPNPNNGYFTVSSNQKFNFSCELLNNLGQTVYLSKNNTSNSTIDVHNLNSGIYFLIVENLNHKEVKKIVVKR